MLRPRVKPTGSISCNDCLPQYQWRIRLSLKHSRRVRTGRAGGSVLGWLPIQFISLLLKRQSKAVPKEKKRKKKGSSLLNVTHACTARTHAHTRIHKHAHTVPAGQQTSSFPPLCTQFPPAGWPTWPARTAGWLGWHRTARRGGESRRGCWHTLTNKQTLKLTDACRKGQIKTDIIKWNKMEILS